MINDFVNTLSIHPYKFSKVGSDEYVLNKYMKNSWPVVYIIKSDKVGEAYVGESTNAINRMKNHLSNDQRTRLDELLVITCDKFNKSAVLDIESMLISYMSADNNYTLQNGNAGLIDHNYYQRKEYRQVFEQIWTMLMYDNYAKNPIERLDNSDLFKYSPFKSLSEDQHSSILEVLNLLNTSDQNTIFVEGGAGTGKSVLAVYLMKLLQTEIQEYHFDDTDESYNEQLSEIVKFKKNYPNPRVALVVPMTSLRNTLKNVFRTVKGLKSSMVIGPSEVSRNEYDLLMVDEAHRLRQRIGLTGYGAFDNANRKLGFDIHEGTELDWILKQSKNQIFFYDEGQSIKPTDIDQHRFTELKSKHKKNVKLTSQMRVKGGNDYISYVDMLLHCNLDEKEEPFENEDYELKLFTDLGEMHDELKIKEEEFGLCRMLAGYSWSWSSKKDKAAVDISIDGRSYKWNNTHIDWINSANAINEIGCIHTSQGYDLNYTGIIFGNEIKYNPKTEEIEIDSSKYFDNKAKIGMADKPEKLKEYILNIYKTMMLRGIKGTYIYVCNLELREYFKKFLKTH